MAVGPRLACFELGCIGGLAHAAPLVWLSRSWTKVDRRQPRTLGLKQMGGGTLPIRIHSLKVLRLMPPKKSRLASDALTRPSCSDAFGCVFMRPTLAGCAWITFTPGEGGGNLINFD